MSRGPSRRLVALAAIAIVLAGGAVAVALFAFGSPPQGGIVPPTGVTVATVDTTPVKPKPPVPRPVAREKPCWEAFGGGPKRALARPDIRLGVPTRAVWARGLHDLMEYPPTTCDGQLYVNLERGRTVALEASSGKVLWSRRASGPTASSPAIAGNRIIVSSHGGTVTALRRRDGRLLWELRTETPVESSPVVVDGVAYVGASDGRLFALNVRTGKPLWIYDLKGRISSSPSVIGGQVCITTYSGAVACLHRADGTLAWIHYFKRDAFRYESFYASASSDGKRLFTVARTGRFLALDPATGGELWSYGTGALTYGTPSTANGRVFVADLGGSVHALRTTTGATLWRTRAPGRILGPTLVVGNLVFFSTLEGRTYAARTVDGRIVWQFRGGKYAPGIATGRRYYFSFNGLLVAFDGTTRSRKP